MSGIRYHHVRVLIEPKHRECQPGTGHDVPVEQRAALAGDVSGQQGLERTQVPGQEYPAPEAIDLNAALPRIIGEDVLITRGVVELALPRVDQHEIGRQLAEINLRPRHIQRYTRSRRQILDEEHRQPFRRHLVYRPEGESHSVRERQVLVDERPRWKRLRIELARREQNLTIRAVDPVPVIIHRHEIVIGPDLLQLSECLQQRVAIP